MAAMTVEIGKCDDTFSYSDEVKVELDKRYTDYKEGRVEMISAETSREKIQALLATKNP